MLKAQMEEIKYVRFEGLKNVLKIGPAESKLCDDIAFVRLNPRNYSLAAVVCEKNPAAPDPIPKNFSLSCSDGLRQLMALRNEAQAKSLAPADACSLFSSSAALPKRKATARVPHSDKKDQRKACDAVDISITVADTPTTISVIKPLHGRDVMWVHYSADTLAAVISFLRACGFSEPLRHYRTLHDDLPEGHRIHKRKNGFIVNMAKGSKFAKSTDDVLAVLHRGDAEAGEGEEPLEAEHEAEVQSDREAEDEADDEAEEANPASDRDESEGQSQALVIEF